MSKRKEPQNVKRQAGNATPVTDTRETKYFTNQLTPSKSREAIKGMRAGWTADKTASWLGLSVNQVQTVWTKNQKAKQSDPPSPKKRA